MYCILQSYELEGLQLEVSALTCNVLLRGVKVVQVAPGTDFAHSSEVLIPLSLKP